MSSSLYHLRPDRHVERERRHLVTRRLLLDWAATVAPAGNPNMAAVGQALRAVGHRAALNEPRARIYFLVALCASTPVPSQQPVQP